MTLNDFIKTETYKTLETFLLSDDNEVRSLVKPIFMSEFGKDVQLLICLISYAYGKTLNGERTRKNERTFYIILMRLLLICSPYKKGSVTNGTLINYWLKYLEVIQNDKR